MALQDKKSLVEKINSFAELEANWDTYGAYAISDKTISYSIRLINSIDADINALPSFVGPNPSGSVVLDWEDGDSSLSFEVQQDGVVIVEFSNFVKYENSSAPIRKVYKSSEYLVSVGDLDDDFLLNNIIFNFVNRNESKREEIF